MSLEATYGIPMILFSVCAVSATIGFALKHYSAGRLGLWGSVAAVASMVAGTAFFASETLSDAGDGTLGIILMVLSVVLMVSVGVMAAFRTEEPDDRPSSPPPSRRAPLNRSYFPPAGYRPQVRVAGRHHPGRRAP